MKVLNYKLFISKLLKNNTLIVNTVLLILVCFMIFLLLNKGLRWVYIPYSIFPKNFEIKENEVKNKKKEKHKYMFNNEDYNLYPSWAEGKYEQTTNNQQQATTNNNQQQATTNNK